MEFKDIEKGCLKTSKEYDEKYNLNHTPDFVLIKLFEEVGELSEAYMTYKKQSRPEKFTTKEEVKKKLAYELADVVGTSIIFANKLDINLEDVINRKWIIKEWEKKK